MTERPNTRISRILAAVGIAAAVIIGAWLCVRIGRTPDQRHPWEFIGLAWLLGLGLYLGWALAALTTVTYTLTDDELLLHQWPRGVAVSLMGPFQVVRWRSRWLWSGNAQQDLGVTSISTFPPLLAGRSTETWVILSPSSNGEVTAMAFQPSHRLLGALKERQHRPESFAG